MNDDATKPIRLLYEGTFTAIDGRQFSYSEADLAGIAASYDQAANPAPLVVGHPKLDTPAFGWVKRVAVEDGELVAHPDLERLDPAFAEAVNAGRYPKVSGSYYAPDDPNNPAPGSWYLKHIGFLGGAAPAVKGLGMVSFAADAAAPVVTIEQATQEKPQMPTEQEVAFAEREAEITRREGDLETRATALTERETALTAAAVSARHDASVAFAEALVGAGKLAPVGRDLTVIVLDGLDADTAVSFGEASETITPAAAFKKLFDGAGTIVAFGEHAKSTGGDGKEDPQDIADRAVAYAQEQAAAARVITIAAAVRHVMKQAD